MRRIQFKVHRGGWRNLNSWASPQYLRILGKNPGFINDKYSSQARYRPQIWRCSSALGWNHCLAYYLFDTLRLKTHVLTKQFPRLLQHFQENVIPRSKPSGKTMVEIARGGATVYSIIIRLSKSCSSYIVAPENQHNSNPRNIFSVLYDRLPAPRVWN